MIFLYIFLILIAAFPLVLTIWRMKRAAFIKKNGIYTDAIVSDIKTMRMPKGGSMDMLTLEYKERTTGRPYYGRATVVTGKNRIGDRMTIAYLPNKPEKYYINTKGAYWVILIFCIILFAFVIFAVYKLNGMVHR